MILDHDGVLCAMEENRSFTSYSSQESPVKRARNDAASTSSSQQSQEHLATPPSSRPSSSGSSPPVEMCADYGKVKTYYRMRVDNIQMMVQMHLTGVIKNDELVRTLNSLNS